MVVATVDAELGHRGQASFIVQRDDPGIRPGKKERKLGIRASDTSEVLLEDCHIPGDRVLGGLDRLEEKLADGFGALRALLPAAGGGSRRRWYTRWTKQRARVGMGRWSLLRAPAPRKACESRRRI